MTHATEQRGSGRSPAKRRRIPFAIAFFVCVVVGILVLLLLFKWGGPRPEDSDLILVPREVAREDNGYWLLVNLPGLDEGTEYKTLENVLKAGGIPVDSDDWDYLVEELQTDFWAWEAWDEALPLKGAPPRAEHGDLRELRQHAVRWKRVETYVDALLERASVALVRLEGALAKQDLVLPFSPPDHPVIACRALDQLPSWGRLARRVRYSATRHFNKGEVEASVDECRRLIRFGRRIARSQAGFIGLAFGQWIEDMGAAHLVQIACIADLPPKRLRELARDLAPPDDLVDTYARETRADYTRLVSWVDDPDQLCGVGPSGPGVFYSPNRILRRHVKAYRGLLEVLDRPGSPEPEAWAGGWEDDWSRVSNWMDPTGTSLSSGIESTCSGYKSLLWESVANARLRMTLVALKIHLIEEDKLPARLGDLVPRYLAEVPVDPSDGTPLRFSPTTRSLYSSRWDDPGMRDLEADYPNTWTDFGWGVWIEDYIPDIPKPPTKSDDP